VASRRPSRQSFITKKWFINRLPRQRLKPSPESYKSDSWPPATAAAHSENARTTSRPKPPRLSVPSRGSRSSPLPLSADKGALLPFRTGSRERRLSSDPSRLADGLMGSLRREIGRLETSGVRQGALEPANSRLAPGTTMRTGWDAGTGGRWFREGSAGSTVEADASLGRWMWRRRFFCVVTILNLGKRGLLRERVGRDGMRGPRTGQAFPALENLKSSRY
jgi:hypothetical protein